MKNIYVNYSIVKFNVQFSILYDSMFIKRKHTICPDVRIYLKRELTQKCKCPHNVFSLVVLNPVLFLLLNTK